MIYTRSSKTYKLCLTGLLSAIAIVGRVALQFTNGVQPVTALMVLMTAFMGLPSALACCVVTVTVTSFFLGWGPWSAYQVAVWSIVALLTKLIPRGSRPVVFCAWALVCGYLYGALVSLFSYKSFVTGGSQAGYAVYWLSGLYPADTLHAIGNALFAWVLYPLFKRFVPDGQQDVQDHTPK